MIKQARSLFLTTFFLTIFFITSFHTAQAQIENDTILASQYYQKADSLLTVRKYSNSVENFNRALLIYKKTKSWQKVASCYNKISENQWRNRKLEESFVNAKKALEISTVNLEKNNIQQAIAYDNIGTYYLKTSQYQDAKMYYKKALEIEERIFPEGHPDTGVTHSNLGLANRYLLELDKALYYQKKALSIYTKNFGPNDEKTASEYNNIANIYTEMGKYHKAVEYHEKNLAITIKNLGEDSRSAAYNYVNLGMIYHDLNQYDKALNYYQKAIPVFLKEESVYPLFVTYNNTGSLLSDRGEDDMALEYNKKGLDMALKIYDEDHEDIAACYWNIGVAYGNKKEYENALKYYNKALDILNPIHKGNHKDITVLHVNIGNIYLLKKDFSLSLEYYQKALEIANRIFKKNNPEIARVYISIANLYLEKKMYDEALVYYQKGLDILEHSEKQNLLTLQALNQVANVYSKKQEYQKANLYFEKAISANAKNSDHQIKESVVDIKKYYNPKFLLETLERKAKMLKDKYLEKSLENDLDESMALYKQADILIDHLRQSLTNYKDKISFTEKAKKIYHDAIAVQLLSKGSQSLEQASYFVEKSKANTLKELLSESTSKNFAGLSDELLNIEKNLKTDRAFYQSKILEEESNTPTIDTLKIKEYENKLFDLGRKQDSLRLVLEKNYPKYHQLKYKNDVAAVSDIQKSLNEHTSLLEFFTSDSITYAFIISKNNLAAQELSTPDLEDKIQRFREAIIAKNINDYKRSSYALYQEILAPIRKNLLGDQLIIIPDGPLWHLNFELLLTQKKPSNNPKELSYLLRDYAITYANSTNLLLNPFKSDLQIEKRKECLAFSFSDSTNVIDTKTMSLATLRNTGDDLPGTREEIKAISDIIDGQYYFGEQAIESNFKKNANQYTILHLALHGEVDNEKPENSRLFFTKSKDTLEDDFLYSHELFALDIPAELTVLSACNTGTGKIAKGEGIMSLGTAFQYAGTKSLLLTGWEVSDQTTPELMKYFYGNLKQGMNKGKALQQAKLQYLNNANVNRISPFYWGGFYLVGDPAPINFNNTSWWYWALGLGSLVILLLIVFWNKKRKES